MRGSSLGFSGSTATLSTLSVRWVSGRSGCVCSAGSAASQSVALFTIDASTPASRAQLPAGTPSVSTT